MNLKVANLYGNQEVHEVSTLGKCQHVEKYKF